MRKRTFTAEQIEFIRDGIAELPTRRLAEAYTQRFREPIGQTEIRRAMNRNGIENPRKEYSMLPIGSERYSKYYDCIMVKIANTSVAGVSSKKERAQMRAGDWALKQNVVWERTTGKKLKWRHIVVFLDGNRMNYSPENLYAVPLNVAGTIEKMHMTSEDATINKTALMWGELYFALKRRNKMKGNDAE